MKKGTLLVTLMVSALMLASCTSILSGKPTPEPTMVKLENQAVLTGEPASEVDTGVILLSVGQDVDTLVVEAGTPATKARVTGNGQALTAADGNTVADSYMQFNVNNQYIYDGQPTPSIRLDVEFLDEGTDGFTVEYDAASGGPFGDGRFLMTHPYYKTGTGRWLTKSYVLKDIRFADRDNGADFRINDLGDGAETIRKVSITVLPVPKVVNVDDCGADPWDDLPDSDAIQQCIARAHFGDIVTFSSGEGSAGYKGYMIDKTIFLITVAPYKYLTFTSTEPSNHALLKATADLKGYVVRAISRAELGAENFGKVDYLTFSHLHMDGNRQERVCLGPDNIDNGVEDNWGSWIKNECTEGGDPWCSPGGIDMSGAIIHSNQADEGYATPDQYSTGWLMEDLEISNVECGSAFGMWGTDNVIYNATINIAGDHVHGQSCARTDPDIDPNNGWSDGMTLEGQGFQILNNTVINASDIGIVFFGGGRFVARNNTILSTEGNYGAFGGIAIHPWSVGNVGFGQIVNNTIVNTSDENCGGLHTGIDLGTHMWGGACISNGTEATIGNAACSADPEPPAGVTCHPGQQCQVWGHVPLDSTFMMVDNKVTGANINYLMEGMELLGEFIQFGNISNTPRKTDWEAARFGCDGITYPPLDFVAHHPTLDGWVDLRVHCER